MRAERASLKTSYYILDNFPSCERVLYYYVSFIIHFFLTNLNLDQLERGAVAIQIPHMYVCYLLSMIFYSPVLKAFSPTHPTDHFGIGVGLRYA